METNAIKPGKFAWTFGILLGVAQMIFSFMLYTMDMQYEQGLAIKIVPGILLLIAVVVAVFQFKKANGGFLKIGDALKLGAGIGLIGAVLGILYFLFHANVLEPEYMDNMLEIGRQQLLAQNPKLTAEDADKMMEMQKSFAWVGYGILIIFNIIIGLVIGLITGLIMKKENPV